MRTLLMLLTSVLLLAVAVVFVPGGYFSLRDEGATPATVPAGETPGQVTGEATATAMAPASNEHIAKSRDTSPVPSSTPVLIVTVPQAPAVTASPARPPVDGGEAEEVVDTPGSGQAESPSPTGATRTETAPAATETPTEEPEQVPSATSTPALTPTPSAEPTAVETSAPTATPPATETPVPSAEPTPDETSTPAPTSTPQATETATAEASPDPCDESNTWAYGPASGTVTASDSPAPDDVTADAYEVTVTFENPEWAPWDYGVAFRDTSDGSVNVVALRSDGVWIHALRRPGEESGREVLDGNTILSIRTDPGSLNTLRLVVSGVSVDVHVNESYVTSITLSAEAGEAIAVRLVLGFLGDDEVQGPVAYQEFTIVCS